MNAFAVYQWALKQGYASGKCQSGDSVGGNLALATAGTRQGSRASQPAAADVGVLLGWI